MHWDIKVPWYGGVLIAFFLLGLWLGPGLLIGYWVWGG